MTFLALAQALWCPGDRGAEAVCSPPPPGASEHLGCFPVEERFQNGGRSDRDSLRDQTLGSRLLRGPSVAIPVKPSPDETGLSLSFMGCPVPWLAAAANPARSTKPETPHPPWLLPVLAIQRPPLAHAAGGAQSPHCRGLAQACSRCFHCGPALREGEAWRGTRNSESKLS